MYSYQTGGVLGVGLSTLALVHVIAVDAMKMPVVHVIDVIAMHDLFATAALAMLVIMMLMDITRVASWEFLI